MPRSLVRSFGTDRSGNFATMFTFVAVPLLLGVAGAIDYGMAYRNVSGMQDALDSALLAAGQIDGTEKDKKAYAEKFLEPHIKRLELTGMDLEVDLIVKENALEGKLRAKYGTFFLSQFGFPKLTLSVDSAVMAGSQNGLEVALVLDNTASLGTDGIAAVKKAAQDFTDAMIKSAIDKSKVKVGVVPFAGAVNVGRDFKTKYLDTTAKSKWHGSWFEWAWIARIDPSCVPHWGSGSGTGPGDGSVESGWLMDGLEDIGVQTYAVYAELFGVKPAHAGEAQTHGLPKDFGIYDDTKNSGCRYLYQPGTISHFDLFDGLKNVKWAGCVEAREEPYDTNDTVPVTGNAATLYVPYFWPDESDKYEDWVPEYRNNYTKDDDPKPWTPSDWAVMEYWGHSTTITKYDGRTISMGAAGQYKSGPNFGCPEPVTPLTTNHGDIISSIANMSLVPAGGTVISEGAAWGWRVLSPREPFTEGSTDADTKRIMVIMSDGENMISRNPQNPGKWGADHTGSPTISDYNSYGYLYNKRLSSPPNFINAEAELDKRTLKICENAKKDGIEIYTVLFRSESERAIKTLQSCASEAKFFYKAADAAALQSTFSSIAASLGRYRLTK